MEPRVAMTIMPTSLPGKSRVRSRVPSSGFTLLELIVVLILVAASAAVILPSFTSGLRGLELETSSRDLVTRMRRARADAIGTQKVFRIILDQLPPAPPYYVLTNDYEEEIGRYPFAKGTLVEIPPSKSFPFKVSFYPNGRSSGGEFLLANEQGKKLYVMVNPITGLGRVARQLDEGMEWR
jgi:general secretion pathway protein H